MSLNIGCNITILPFFSTHYFSTKEIKRVPKSFHLVIFLWRNDSHNMYSLATTCSCILYLIRTHPVVHNFLFTHCHPASSLNQHHPTMFIAPDCRQQFKNVHISFFSLSRQCDILAQSQEPCLQPPQQGPTFSRPVPGRLEFASNFQA